MWRLQTIFIVFMLWMYYFFIYFVIYKWIYFLKIEFNIRTTCNMWYFLYRINMYMGEFHLYQTCFSTLYLECCSVLDTFNTGWETGRHWLSHRRRFKAYCYHCMQGEHQSAPDQTLHLSLWNWCLEDGGLFIKSTKHFSNSTLHGLSGSAFLKFTSGVNSLFLCLS